MPVHKRRYTVAAIVTLTVPFLYLIARHGALAARLPTSRYAERCGREAVLWMIACCGTAAFAFAILAAGFFYVAWRQERGHTLKGLCYRLSAIFAAICAAFSSIFLGVGRAPCWVAPSLYIAIALTASIAAVGLVGLLRVLRAMPDGYAVQRQMDALQERIDRLRENPGGATVEDDLAAVDLLTECKETLSAVNDFIGRIQARPVNGLKTEGLK